MSPQLSLLPDAPAEIRREPVRLELIDGFANAAPSAKLRELIRELGLLQPVVIVAKRNGRFDVVEGRRRCKAIAQLADQNQWPTPPEVDALALNAPEASRAEVRGGLALALHATRSASPASELREIEAILKTGDADGDVATVKEIAAQTAMSVQTVRRRLRLRSLILKLRDAFDQGMITASVAEAAARLPEPEQQALTRQLAERGKLTLLDVREVARQRNDEAKADLPSELFCDRELPWPAIVRGHIIAALQALPKTEQPLAARLEAALARVERA
ncbi:MAG TPA: ParB/Srx family N-terminal domain-containing protein [Solirubrobacteraceae bacterium]